ncbi:MAG: aldo/keto reductase [Clostridiales bacterium]|nr:aldo/keto reductase [Clostridiales bacterium]
MEYGKLKYVERPVSRLIFGTAIPELFAAMRSLHGDEPDFIKKLDRAFELLDAAYDLGIQTFDCANHYGEEPLGEWMKDRGLIDKVTVLTKGAHHNAWRKRVTDFDILSDAHDSLKKLNRDRIDIYVLHRDDPEVPVGPIVEALNRLHREGKIGAFGASNWTHQRISEANAYALEHGLVPFTVSSPNYGLADQVDDPWGGGCVTISGPSNADARRWYAENNMPVIAYSSLGRGLFSGRVKSNDPESALIGMDEFARKGYLCPENMRRLARAEELAAEKGLTVPEIAMAWIMNQKLDVYAVVASANRDRMKSNIRAAKILLSETECRWLNLETDER